MDTVFRNGGKSFVLIGIGTLSDFGLASLGITGIYMSKNVELAESR